eukprot:TRINITY_DN394_c0_g1_i2.p1 TRINITY_DN394_c0_g1~~TRINITY_DN394_c0_g1_i2.p1  ORF type:complete len:194 (+),score=49.22 TRINITY_DN394_c0_g1_i2:65-646(+)
MCIRDRWYQRRVHGESKKKSQMIIRKATKIELKPEDDYCEYEEYKRKQMESMRGSRLAHVVDAPMRSKVSTDKMMISETFGEGQGFTSLLSGPEVAVRRDRPTFMNPMPTSTSPINPTMSPHFLQGLNRGSEATLPAVPIQTNPSSIFSFSSPNPVTAANPRITNEHMQLYTCLLYTSPSPRDRQKSRMPSSA